MVRFPQPPVTGSQQATAGLSFMTHDASDAELLTATAVNHVDWMSRLARASGGTVTSGGGVHWTYVARAAKEVTVAVTEPPGPAIRNQLDELLALCRARRADRIGYWAFDEDYRRPLGAWLGARGFRPGGRPHWMALDLMAIPDLPPLAELTALTGVAPADKFIPQGDSVLPCFHPDTARVREAMAAERPRRVWHAVQWQEGQPAAQVSYCVTPGELGVCGLHDTVAVDSARVQGFGLARAQWMFRFAADLGARYAVTNAAAETVGLYRMLGFRSLGFGQTWWLAGPALQRRIQPETVAFAEALGCGDVEALEEMVRSGRPLALDDPLPCQLTPVQFAGATGRENSARWLLAHGARPDLLAAWDLGWRAESHQLLADNPGLLNRQRLRSGKSLLHIAVERDDLELAEFLLDEGIDDTLTDSQFDSTALDWARELKRARIAATIRRHGQAAPHQGGG